MVLLPLEPIAYPRPNEVKQRLTTALKKPAANGCRFSMKERLNYDENKSLTFRFDKSVCMSFSLVDYIYFVILCISEYEEIVA